MDWNDPRNVERLITAQRGWVRKRFGEEIAATLRVQFTYSSYITSAIGDEDGEVWSFLTDRGLGYRVQHKLSVGRRTTPYGEWVYPDWVPMPPPLKRLVKPGALVLKASGRRHLLCVCRVESSRAKVAGGSPRRFAQYQLLCVDENCGSRAGRRDDPVKYFSFSDSQAASGGSAARLITLPITLEAITTERNTEVRRALIEIYGPANYLCDAHAELVSQDDWGKLWRLSQNDDEPLVMVEMVNSTPEPDGSHKSYWERVPPNMWTPLQALAWQANVSPQVYAQMTVQT